MRIGTTITDNLLNAYASRKSKCIRCCVALVIPQPKHSLLNRNLETQIDWPLSKKVEGMIIKINGMTIIPPKIIFNLVFFKI